MSLRNESAIAGEEWQHAVAFSEEESDLPLPPRNPDLVKLFRLSDDERRWALQLKAAVESSPQLENLSDLQYVQFALAHSGDMDKMLQRVEGLQEFRHEYKILNTFDDGMAVIFECTKVHPFCLLSVAYDDVTENYGMIYDRSRIQLDIIKTHADWRKYLGQLFYVLHSLCPDPLSMRNGIFMIGEHGGMQRSAMSIDKHRILWDHFLSHYPVFFRSIKAFHTNGFANLAYSMMKLFLNREITDRIDVGCQFGTNIASLYLLPSPEMSVLRLVRRLEVFLKTRYQNEASFSLSAPPWDPFNLQANIQGT
jgi:hypothetical protein